MSLKEQMNKLRHIHPLELEQRQMNELKLHRGQQR